MFILPLLLLLWCGFLVSAQEKHVRISIIQHKRDAASCEQTYGVGSQPCGNRGSTYCFNPSLGQSCCAADSGFCDSGKYCAPIAGYCCLENEDLATCARNAGFEIPGSLSNASSTSTVTSATLTVLPFLKESQTPTPTIVNIQNNSCSFSTSANLHTAMSTPISYTNTTAPPTIQVSFAVKRVGISFGGMSITGLIGVFAIFFRT